MAAHGDGAARAAIARANWIVTICAARRRDIASVDGYVAATVVTPRANASTSPQTRSRHVATVDGYVATRRTNLTTTDAGRMRTAYGIYRAAVDCDVANITADARAKTSRGVYRAAFDDNAANSTTCANATTNVCPNPFKSADIERTASSNR
jgi:hypothetical protein